MLATKPSTADSWYKYIDNSINVNNKDGYADGVKSTDYTAILNNLATAKTAADQVAIWQSFLRDIANGTGVYAGQKDAVIKQAKAKYGTAFAQWMKDASIPTAIQDIYTNEPLAKLPDYMQGYLAVNPNDATSVANYTTTLNNQLGTLTDSKGNKLLTPGYISSVASGNPGFFDDLTNKVDTAAYDAATKQLGTSAPNLSSAERASFIKDFLYNPDKINAVLHPADTGTKTDNTGTKTDNTGTSTPSGLTSLINPKLLDAQGNYRPYLSTWTAPKQGVASTNSIYSGLLDAMLNKVTGANYGTPETNKTYDALTSALTQGVGVNSLSKPKATYSADNPAGITGLGIDYTGRTLTPLNTQVTSSPSYSPNQIANAKTALENAQDIVSTEKGGISDILAKKQAEEKAALEKAAAEKAAADKAALEKAAAEKAAADALARQQAADALARQQAADALARQQAQAQADKAAADALARQQAADRTQAQVQSVSTQPPYGVTLANGKTAMGGQASIYNPAIEQAQQAALEKAALEKAAAEKAAAEKAAADALAKATNPITGYVGPSATNGYVGPPTWNPNAGMLSTSNNAPVQTQATVTPLPIATTTNPTPAQSGNLGVLSLPANTVVQSPVNAISNQTVTPVITPQPVYAATTNPTPAQSGNLGIINPATLGPVVSPQAMNSTAGGVASLVGPQVQAQPVQAQPVQTATSSEYVPFWKQMGFNSAQAASAATGFDEDSWA